MTATAGKKYKPKPTSGYWSWVGDVRLITSTTLKGEVYWWVEMADKHGGSTLETVRGLALKEQFEPVPDFFKVDRTYRFIGNTKTTYLVKEVYQVDKPATDYDKLSATLLATDPDGRSYITLGNPEDFKRMQEVIDL